MRKPLPWFWKVFFFSISGLFLVGGAVVLWASTVQLPDVSTFQARKIANSSKIMDRTGKTVLYDIHQSVRRTEVPLGAISPHIQNASIAIEDSAFYRHRGVRVQSIVRAFISNVFSGNFSQGGSTITQQIIKNTLLTPEKTVVRKIKEWVLALKLERSFSKEEILAMYLNDNPYGGTIYGVEEASRAFFNKSASEVSLAEAAYLAAIPQAPTYYSPFGNNRNKLDERKNIVLKRMKQLDFISEREYQEALTTEVSFDNSASNGIRAPHFVFYIQSMLEERFGKDAITSGGYTIITTLDYELQAAAEKIIEKYAEENFKNFNASNAALVAIDPPTGAILAMVGSRDYFDDSIDGAFNVATAKRQPGSSFKPFVYAAAFEKGYTPETVLFDLPTEFSTACTAFMLPLPGKSAEDCYHPGNFDDTFRGPLSLRQALGGSINVPSVKLLYLVGLQEAIDLARRMGINTLGNPNRYGLSLVLGGGEVSLLDMTSAYGVFAAEGIRHEPFSIIEIKNRAGKVVETHEARVGQEVLSRNTALTISDVLSDNNARAATFGYNSPLHIQNVPVAAKTGTTNDNRDAWIIGYTPNLVVGVWSGNNNNAPMKKGGAAISGPIWNAFMQEVLPKFSSVGFEKPIKEDSSKTQKPILGGQWAIPAPLPYNPTISSVQTILYWVDKKDPLGPPPQNPENDPLFSLWNPPIVSWWQKQHPNTPTAITL